MKGECWLTLDFEDTNNEDSYKETVNRVTFFLKALGLFKSTLSLLAVGGLRVKRFDEKGSVIGGNFGWETTIISRPYYSLCEKEHDAFIDFITKYDKFWQDNKLTNNLDKQIRRINVAEQFFFKSLQSITLVERQIYLCIALEALYGEGQDELKYRYSNRAALLLGDSSDRRKQVYNDVKEAYGKRSDILHGGISWSIKGKEVLTLNEIIRQSLLRCMSLYSNGYKNIGKALDDCIHDPSNHENLLKNAKICFNPHSNYKGDDV